MSMSILFATRICASRRSYARPLFSTTTSSISTFSGALARRQPTFTIPANDIRILAEPKEFYALLLDMIQRARKRIFLSSLYIGSGETQLMDALSDALERNPGLRLDVQLDLNRCTRPGQSSTAHLLLPLLQAHPERVTVHLFRSPHLRGILANIVPPRFNEGWGTWHAKIYGADDEVIISGANLSSDYFTNRRDRYISFSNSHLADYCRDFMRVASSFSYRLLPAGNNTPQGPHSYRRDGYIVDWPDHETHPHYINDKLGKAFKSLQAAHREKAPAPNSQDVQVYPMIQGGQFDVREEEETIALLFEHLEGTNGSLLDLTSGYFNLYKPYQKLILEASNMERRVVAASPKANGFYGSKGVSGRIPEGYTILERRFMKKVGRSGNAVQLKEWEREGWTYHAKGLWLSPDISSDPLLTMFGSTNMNARSAQIDTELSFMMFIPPSEEKHDGEDVNAVLRHRLAEEVSSIRRHSKEWTGNERHVRPLTPFMLWLVEDML